MAGMNDLVARSQAAAQSMGGVDPSAVVPGDVPPGPGGTEGAPPQGPPGGGMDIESALQQVEAAVEGMPEDVATEIREHLSAIREAALKAEGGDTLPPTPEEGGPEEPNPVDLEGEGSDRTGLPA